MSYPFIRRLLFRLDPETSHELTLDLLGAAARLKLLPLFVPPRVVKPVRVMGLEFPNAVGLAAGLDKNGDCIDGLAALGFGFLELGTVTPRPQPGNPRPRLFRLTERQAIINRMGFNNRGVDYLIERVRQARYKGVLGINVGKNADTPVDKATDDYLIGMRKVYPYASYITVNVSSPNTPGLRTLQFGDALRQLVESVKNEQRLLAAEHGRYVPVAFKIAPDMSDEEVRLVAQTLLEFQVDGVIATNTTLSREGVKGLPHAAEQGGLSGAPLRDISTRVVRVLAESLQGRIPIIAVGGILDAAAAVEKIDAGASLVQIYSGLIYRGPALVREAAEAIALRQGPGETPE